MSKMQDYIAEYKKQKNADNLKKIITEVQSAEVLWIAFSPRTKNHYVDFVQGVPAAFIFSEKEYGEQFCRHMKESGITIGIAQCSTENRLPMFTDLYRSGFEGVIIDNGKNYLFLEMGTIVNPPDYTGLPDGQRPVINGALLCSGNRFFQCLENKSVTPDKELNLLVDTYNAKYLVPTVGDPQEGSITIPGLERSDGVKVVPFFTDIHEYRKYDMEGKHKIAVVSYEQIKSLCFDGQTVVINPMGFNYTLTKETCEAVEKAHSAVGDANDQDRAVIYAPDDIPMTLINELCTVLDNVDGVLKAYIKGLRKSGEKELLIALDCGDASRERAVEIATEAEKKSDSVKSERKLRFIPAASDVGKIASKDTPPFFERIIIDATIDPDAEADE